MQFYDYSLIAGVIAVLFAFGTAYGVLKKPDGNEKMRGIAQAIKEGATAYLNRQLMTILVFGIIIAILIGIFLTNGTSLVIAFIVGAIASYLTAYLGMNVAVRTNIRTAQAATKGLDSAFRTALFGGAVTGFAAVGFGLIGLSLLLMLFTTSQLQLLIGFGFGASLVSLFARVGGGIYTKAADVGADLVGKTELNLPEDDPRNPAVIADNVGDNVGDCAGMAADVFESYAVTLVAALLIAFAFTKTATSYAYPLLVASTGVIASIISLFFMRVNKEGNVTRALYFGIGGSLVVAAILDYALTIMTGTTMTYFIPVLAGLVISFALFAITDYYTGNNAKSVIKVATAAQGGAGTDVILGLAVGLRSTWVPLIVVVIGILVSYYEAGVYGIGIAAVGMLSLTATILTIDSFGPITDNAGGIAEMSGMPHAIRKITDKLDAIGNMTKATTKGFAIGGAALSSIALFVAFAQAVNLTVIDVLNPLVVVGIFIGAMLPFIFSSFLMESVGYAANLMVEEVRRQVRTIKGLLQGKAKPDYAKVVDIATVTALKSLIIPEMIAIVTPILVGFVLGRAALGGLLVGMIPASFMLALFMANSGAAMDNAKKYVEEGHFGGKGSDAHKASVVGDTVGDPLKDTAGPSLNSMIKVVSTISILLAPVFLMYAAGI
ncbi:MAG: sodium-translocating pyrophosphatase [Candidatus Micrarchaeota archaeon]|nr:sodium-translocating pyrophosphatase [Candidatus Micrarchaeota archaeon]